MLRLNEKTKTLLLDMDGTLLDLSFDTYFWLDWVPAKLAEKRGMSTAEVMPDFRAALKAQEGHLNWYCLDYWSSELKMDLADLKHQIRDRIGYLAGAQEFLQAARKAGLQLVMLTNAHPQAVTIKNQRTGVCALMDQVISSHELGFPKESAEFWQRLVDKHRVDLSQSVMIDDSKTVLARARQFVDVIGINCPDTSGTVYDHQEVPSVDGVRLIAV
ncbi:MAG: HAD-IA family hydrolase [Pseudomonadota bacterium]